MIFYTLGAVMGIITGVCFAKAHDAARIDWLANEVNRLEMELERNHGH